MCWIIACVVRVELVIETWRTGRGDLKYCLNLGVWPDRHLDWRGHVMHRANIGPAAPRSREVKIPTAIRRDGVGRHAGTVLDVPGRSAQEGRGRSRRGQRIAASRYCKRRPRQEDVDHFHMAAKSALASKEHPKSSRSVTALFFR